MSRLRSAPTWVAMRQQTTRYEVLAQDSTGMNGCSPALAASSGPRSWAAPQRDAFIAWVRTGVSMPVALVAVAVMMLIGPSELAASQGAVSQ
jgi:hypothetical protein